MTHPAQCPRTSQGPEVPHHTASGGSRHGCPVTVNCQAPWENASESWQAAQPLPLTSQPPSAARPADRGGRRAAGAPALQTS